MVKVHNSTLYGVHLLCDEQGKCTILAHLQGLMDAVSLEPDSKLEFSRNVAAMLTQLRVVRSSDGANSAIIFDTSLVFSIDDDAYEYGIYKYSSIDSFDLSHPAEWFDFTVAGEDVEYSLYCIYI